MRGLNHRIAYARAKVLAIFSTDQEKLDDIFFSIALNAEEQGVTDYRNGLDTCPLLFKGVKLLVQRWKQGWDYGEVLADL